MSTRASPVRLPVSGDATALPEPTGVWQSEERPPAIWSGKEGTAGATPNRMLRRPPPIVAMNLGWLVSMSRTIRTALCCLAICAAAWSLGPAPAQEDEADAAPAEPEEPAVAPEPVSLFDFEGDEPPESWTARLCRRPQ